MLRLTKAVAKIKCDTEENDEIRVSINISKNPSVVNTISIWSFHHIHMVTYTMFQLKHRWLLTKVLAKMKSNIKQKGKIGLSVHSLL